MYLVRIDFQFDAAKGTFEEYVGEVGWLMAAYYRNGQQVRAPVQQWREGDILRVQALVPARDALSNRHGNAYVRSRLKELRRRSIAAPRVRNLGAMPESLSDCRCRRSGRFLLFASRSGEAPPVRCGDCFLAVPLYRLPYATNEDEHASLISWEREYQACEDLWFGGVAGEGFAYRQISSLKSKLTKFGRALCADLESKTGRPFYYPLFLYRRHQSPRCPGCRAPWELETKDWYYRYRCERCRLLGEKSTL